MDDWLYGIRPHDLFLCYQITDPYGCDEEPGVPLDHVPTLKIVRMEKLVQVSGHRITLPVIVERLSGRTLAVFIGYHPIRRYPP